jgi:predicted site-specific integrase-resolvase
MERSMSVVHMPRLITLEEWAERMFGKDRIGQSTLYKWRRDGWIVPSPIKVGRQYFVEPNAVYADEQGEMAKRFGNGRA